MPQEYIEIRGARENNLKNVSLRIPKRKITIFTGVSGSGKSSIVFDTIATEAQRQLNENFSMFVRNFLPRYSQPEADAHREPEHGDRGGPEAPGRRLALDRWHDHRYLHRAAPAVFARRPAVRRLPPMCFRFNDPQGMCPKCNGLGRKLELDVDKFLDTSKSLNEGAILVPDVWTTEHLPGYRACSTPTRNYQSTPRRKWTCCCTAKTTNSRQIGGNDVNMTFRASSDVSPTPTLHATLKTRPSGRKKRWSLT